MTELRATYRLQLTTDFGFAQAQELVPYLRDLGISHLYLSPSFQARAGSTHGYDVIDPGRFSDALGGMAAFRELADAARGAGMGIVLDLRARQQRNFLATLFLSQGTPMLLGGDERGRTQYGNNNGWCQDNEISWFEWSAGAQHDELHDFTRRLIALRHDHPVFRRESFLIGSDEADAAELPDAWWFRADGRKMTKADWDEGEPVLGLFLNGEAIPTPGPRGERIVDDSFLLLFNACGEDRTFTLPRARLGDAWELELSTADPAAQAGSDRFAARAEVTLIGRSLMLVKRVNG